ncbi:helix-turn-helix domain-containing protein, partial [Enterococcus cecorum]
MWEKLEKYLTKKQISMYQLSKMTGIPEATINNIKHK